MNLHPCFTYLLSDRGEISNKRSGHNSVARLKASWKCAQGRPCPSYGANV